MTSGEWMTKNFGSVGPEKYFQSLYKDSEGNIYSYGTHYPLLFKVGHQAFRNTQGYSNTTAKHIHWARDVSAIDVKLWPKDTDALRLRYAMSVSERMAIIQKALEREGGHAIVEMSKKKRTDTQVYRCLQSDLASVNERIKELAL